MSEFWGGVGSCQPVLSVPWVCGGRAGVRNSSPKTGHRALTAPKVGWATTNGREGARRGRRALSLRGTTERFQRKASLGKLRSGQGSRLGSRDQDERKEKGRKEGASVLTGHGDGSGSGLPPLRPLVPSDVAGPAPFCNETRRPSPPHPLMPGHRLPLGRKSHAGPRAKGLLGGSGAEVRGRRGAGLHGRGRRRGLEKLGRITWREGGVCGWRCGAPGSKHVTGQVPSRRDSRG